MSALERDVVLTGQSGGRPTIDLPITRLANVEGTADIKEAPAAGDYLPIVDSGDGGQMKKAPIGAILDPIAAARTAAENAQGTADGAAAAAQAAQAAADSAAAAAAGAAQAAQTAQETAVGRATMEQVNAAIAAGSWIPSEGRLLARGSEVFNGAEVDAESVGWRNHIEGGEHTLIGGDCVHIEGLCSYVDGSVDAEEDYGCGVGPMIGAHVEGFGHNISISRSAESSGLHVEGRLNRVSYSGYYMNMGCEGTHVEGAGHDVRGASFCHIGGSGNIVCRAAFAFVDGRSNTLEPVVGDNEDGTTMDTTIDAPTFVYGDGNNISQSGDGGVVFGCYNTLTCGASEEFSRYFAILGKYLDLPASTLARPGAAMTHEPIVLMGQYNNREQLDGYLIVGNGFTMNDRSNCFRVTGTGVYASGSYHSAGADYAELFEWADGNPGGEDRVGRFVTLDGDKMRLAQSGDPLVLGVVSGFPSVIGDSYDDQWQGMYQCDAYGRPVWEEAEIQEGTGTASEAGAAGRTRTVRRRKLNPDYDPEQAYIPRSKRPEWGCVGLMGKLTVIDDGSCQVNGWCAPGTGGIAVHSEERTDFRVIRRIDATHVRVLALGRR